MNSKEYMQKWWHDYIRDHPEWKERKRVYDKEYRRTHPKKQTAADGKQHTLYVTRRRKEDLGFRLSTNLRARLGLAIRKGQKSGSAVRDLGCSIEELKRYLESKFQPEMTWENWGLKGWHIDHIKPLVSYDLTDRNQFLEANHFSNLQPLWWYDNLGKRRPRPDGNKSQ
jgi:hypothetical protein